MVPAGGGPGGGGGPGAGRPVRILVVSNMYPGPRKPHYGIFVARRVEAYRRLGAEVAVAAITDPRRGPLRTPRKYAALTLRALGRAIRFRPDVLEGHYLVPTALVTRLAAGVVRRPYVLYAHGTDLETRIGWLEPLVARAVAGAAEVHTNSEHTAGRIGERFPAHPEVVVLPPGVDTARFRPPDDALPLTEEPTVAFVGDLVLHKGADVLVRALARLAVPWRAVVVGEGPEGESVRALAEELGVAGRVSWAGRVPHEELPALLGRAAVAAVPSRRDALGQVAIEALACGVPVVVSGVGGLAEIPTPECGSVVPPDRPDLLAEALEGWLQRRGEPAVRAAARGRAGEFALERVASRALDRLGAVPEVRRSSAPG